MTVSYRCNSCGAGSSLAYPHGWRIEHDERLSDGSLVEHRCPVCKSHDVDVSLVLRPEPSEARRAVKVKYKVSIDLYHRKGPELSEWVTNGRGVLSVRPFR